MIETAQKGSGFFECHISSTVFNRMFPQPDRPVSDLRDGRNQNRVTPPDGSLSNIGSRSWAPVLTEQTIQVGQKVQTLPRIARIGLQTNAVPGNIGIERLSLYSQQRARCLCVDPIAVLHVDYIDQDLLSIKESHSGRTLCRSIHGRHIPFPDRSCS
ncbi:hypothetical protein KUV51_06155 [Tateyamaria omphalii]|uniref:hypothetical protein n=1 Tax=Tateyamaria omphalii TaxID=299262 RepID=UPI001C99B678|nr:hypothetical protein [Tateyamaria omphalii]MBY5932576.1 hypothetical protein [Tateyamaria omphalii]